MTNKPDTCRGCPLFSASTFEAGKGVRPASVLFLGTNPPNWGGLFSDNGGKILRYIIAKLKSEYPGDKAIIDMNARNYMMYSVCCAGKVVNDVVDKCKSSITAQMLKMASPSVIVAIGREACHFMGIQGNITDVRGTIHECLLAGDRYKVIPTLPLSTLDASPGLFDIVKNDILKAARTAANEPLDSLDVASLIRGYSIPKTLDEAIAVCEEFSVYSNGRPIENTMMSLDFETTTLFPWNSRGRIIAMSGAVGPGKAFSLLVDHRDSKYKFKDIAPYIVKVLSSKHPKAWWNYKYDYSMARFCLVPRILELVGKDPAYKKVFEEIAGVTIEHISTNGPINNTRWDGLLGEHMLQEDKKGFYSLKEVVGEHYPSLVGYERELSDLYEKQVIAKKEKLLSDIFEDPMHSCIGVKVVDTRVLAVEGMPEGIIEWPEYLKEKIKSMKAEERKKKTKPEIKEKLKDTIGIYESVLESVKSELAYTKAAVSSWYTTMCSTSMSMADPRREMVTYEDIDINVMLPYAAIDADLTWRISNKQRIQAIKEDPTAAAIADNRPEMIRLMDSHYIPLTEVLAEMQREGVRVDREFLAKERLSLGVKIINLEDKIISQVKNELNRDISITDLNSHQATADLMVGGYGLPKLKETDSGAVSTDRDTMAKYAEMGNSVAQLILEYRDSVKANSTYVEAFLELSDYDGRIHGAIHLNGTATGRASSSNPNLQNITTSISGINIKQAFIPTDTTGAYKYDMELCRKYRWEEGEKLVMVDIDFSGAEIRGLTAYVNDSALIGALEKNLDIHSWIASVIFNEDYETVNRLRKSDDKYHQMRQKAKTIVFGLIYGISNVGLADRLNIETSEADALMATFFTRFPKIAEYIDSTKAKITKECILRTPTGRARRFPMVQMGGQVQSRNHRQGINYLVQSFCAEIVLRVICNLRKEIHAVRARLVLTVHDSIVMEMPETSIPILKDFLVKNVDAYIKANFPQLPVNMPYDIKVGRSYGEAE